MNKAHELAEKIFELDQQCKFGREEVNQVITAWLEEKAEKIAKCHECHAGSRTHRILGLSEPDAVRECEHAWYDAGISSKQPYCAHCHAIKPKDAPMEPDAKKWCEHIFWKEGEWRHRDSKIGAEWSYLEVYNFCGYCGTPRPAEKKVRLWEILMQKYKEQVSFSAVLTDASFRVMASAAVQWMEEIIDKTSFDNLFDEFSKKEKLKAAIREEA